jgi:DNA-binding PadR family transcriptional regulator
MMKTEEVARLILDGAEITYDRGSQRWHVAEALVRKQTLHSWEKLGYITRDFPRFEAGDKEYYKLTEQGRESLTWIYFPDESSRQLL